MQTVWLLALKNDENKRKIAENEGVGAVLNAIACYFDSNTKRGFGSLETPFTDIM
jgi:hypothetical protein